ncbi:MAG: hypothetical protein ACI9R3_006006 [Verrucomicrobiales bacterium]
MTDPQIDSLKKRLESRVAITKRGLRNFETERSQLVEKALPGLQGHQEALRKELVRLMRGAVTPEERKKKIEQIRELGHIEGNLKLWEGRLEELNLRLTDLVKLKEKRALVNQPKPTQPDQQDGTRQPDTAVDSKSEANEISQSDERDAPRPEKETFFNFSMPNSAQLDFAKAAHSIGDRVILHVREGQRYRVRVVYWPGEDEQIVNDRVVEVSSDVVNVGLWHSFSYSISGDAVVVNKDECLLILEVDGESFTREAPELGYRPHAIFTKEVDVSQEEQPFLIMYHGNNMGPATFDMAAEFAPSAADAVVATIQELRDRDSEQDAALKVSIEK